MGNVPFYRHYLRALGITELTPETAAIAMEWSDEMMRAAFEAETVKDVRFAAFTTLAIAVEVTNEKRSWR